MKALLRHKAAYSAGAARFSFRRLTLAGLSVHKLNMPFTSTIQRWFKEQWGGSLKLPDGWYGRPYDNQHALTSVDESGDTLIIVLDRKLTLHFEGLKSVKWQNRELVFGPFDRLRFDWESFGTQGQRGSKEYQDGEVRIISAPG